MIFALAHATLGWALAMLACLILRRRSADARCWTWRLGLLKGPLALVLAIPVVVATRPPIRKVEVSALPVDRILASDLSAPLAPRKKFEAPVQASAPASYPLFLLYGAGVGAVVLARLAAAKRVHRGMPRVEGVLRPRIFVPSGLGHRAAAMALAHEHAHVRRRDPQWSMAADVVCALFWFAPPVWLCSRAMRAEAEAACDAAALAETGAARGDYARLLLTFAGPAPANALGGPARRLARRILMLNKTQKPLPRLVAAGLLALGLVALLPWRAEAHPGAPFTTKAGSAPARLSLDKATSGLMDDQEIRKELGITPQQELTLQRAIVSSRLADLRGQIGAAQANVRGNKNKSRAALERQQAQLAMKKSIAARLKLLQEQMGKRTTVLSITQQAKLKALALARYGGALWEQPEVVERLKLRNDQLVAIAKENDRIQAYIDESPMSKDVQTLIASLKAQRDAKGMSEGLKKAIDSQIKMLSRRDKALEPYAILPQQREQEAWKMRGAADERIRGLLDEDQRRRLDTLTSGPAAWSASVGQDRFLDLPLSDRVISSISSGKGIFDPIEYRILPDAGEKP